jgi:hypothetical protein
VDAYGPEERAIGWYYYLENKLRFPFQARCAGSKVASPLKKGEIVEVFHMAPKVALVDADGSAAVLTSYLDVRKLTWGEIEKAREIHPQFIGPWWYSRLLQVSARDVKVKAHHFFSWFCQLRNHTCSQV